jgi:ABC-type ATPase involved in cell division
VTQARAKVPDMNQLADRHNAVARRVTALEEGSGLSESVVVDPNDLQERLLARLGRARHAAPDGGPLPAILDEPFLNVPAGHKWDLLDMVERLSEGSQIIYLTDDPYVAAWAKRRSDSGAIKLLAASNG